MTSDVSAIKESTLSKIYKRLHEDDGVLALNLADLLGVGINDLKDWIRLNGHNLYSWVEFVSEVVLVYKHDDLMQFDEFRELLRNKKLKEASFISSPEVQILLDPEEFITRKLSIGITIAKRIVNSVPFGVKDGCLSINAAAALSGITTKELVNLMRGSPGLTYPDILRDDEVA